MKIVDHRDLPEERLATTSEDGSRVYLFPAAVQGFFRRWRTVTQVVLIVFFLILPWIKIGGHQSVLIDIKDRQFALLGLTFWAHDTPILFFVVLIAVMALAFVTAVWGRVWCGWACPQSVFIDGVFRRIETWWIGNHVAQIQLAKAPWSLHKIYKVAIKWLMFIAVSLVISHSFIAYFVGVDELGTIMTHHPFENWVTFLVMLFITGVLAFDFGWFREQFCIIMCPYGRIQSLLMDQGSMAVLYNEQRGEPRGKPTAATTALRTGEHTPQKTQRGDCIDCYKCVSVCPTGIDIRRGLQMECIACTACIDVCNEVMTKINKPKNLIQYTSLAEQQGHKKRIWTPRVFIYLSIILVAVLGLSVSVARRTLIDISVLRGHDRPFSYENESEKSGRILNHFKLHIKNQDFHPIEIRFTLTPETQGVDLISPINPVPLKAGELQRIPFFVRFDRQLAAPNGQFKIHMQFFVPDQNVIEKEVILVAPME